MVLNGVIYVIGGLFDDMFMDCKIGVFGFWKVLGLGKFFWLWNLFNIVCEIIFFIILRVVEEM